MIQIFIVQRLNDFMAELYIDGKFKGFDCAKTKDEAIGAVIRTCQQELKVEILESKSR
jgi:hypothetical protein